MKKLLIHSLSHLIIDMASAFLISSVMKEMEAGAFYIMLALLGYNAIAFLMQPFFGYFVDIRKNAEKMAVIALLLGSVAFLFIKLPVLLVIFIGIANAVYHASGGSIVLRIDISKSFYAGVFVSTGALGLYLGYLLASLDKLYFLFLMMVLILLSLVISQTEKTTYHEVKQNRKKWFYLMNTCLISVIFLRGMAGGYLFFSWNKGWMAALVVTLAVVLGKMAGGFFGDRIGLIKVAVFALFASAPLLTFLRLSPVAGILGLILFNFSMPVTLYLLSDNLRGYEGFAFGVTAFFLMAGSFLSFSGVTVSEGILFAYIIMSGILLYLYQFMDRREERK